MARILMYLFVLIASFSIFHSVSATTPSLRPSEFLEETVITSIPELPDGIRIVDGMRIENSNDEFVYVLGKRHYKNSFERIIGFFIGCRPKIPNMPKGYCNIDGRISSSGHELYSGGKNASWYESYRMGQPETTAPLYFYKTEQSNPDLVEAAIFYQDRMYIFKGEKHYAPNPQYGADILF